MSTGWELEFYENKKEYLKLIESVMTKKQETDISFLEDSLCSIIGRKYAVSVSNGTDALFFSLIGLGIKPGDEVLVTNFSWISSASCVSMVGAIPVFCDIDINTYHMDINSIERMCSDKTRALIYPHLFGNMSDTTDIINFCKDRNILFIEDACQAIGASFNGVKAGTLGITSALSFNSNKNIAGISGGGAILTDDKELYNKFKKMRVHGNGEFLGYNSKMLLLNATIIDHRLKNLQKWQFIRQKHAEMYNTSLENLPLKIQINDLVDHNYHKYVVRFENKETRNKIQKLLNATVHYEKPISENLMYNSIRHRKDNFNNSQIVCDTILTLPLNHYTQIKEVLNVIDILWKNL